MFSKGTTPQAVKDNVPSIISHGTHIVGDVTTEGEVQIDGKVEGNIRCHSLIVADTGEVTGKVTCDSVMLHGTLSGTIHAKSVSLSCTAHMVGDVTHEKLTIEPGAHFKGQCIPIETKKDGVVALSGTRNTATTAPQKNDVHTNGSFQHKPKEAAQA